MTIQDFTIVNRRLEEERRKQYRGTASLCLTSLQYEEKDPQAMKTIFRQERGCRKEDHRHHARALISQQALEAAMSRSSISREKLMADTLPYPELEFPPGFKIECIEGHDRLAAAEKVLQGSKKRWIVDLYLDSSSNELRMLLADGYDYQKKPDDGEIYIKIRQFQGYHGDRNPFFENLWLARFATNTNSKRLFDALTKHRKFSAAFNKLLDVPALFGGFRLSVIHQLLSMKCDEPNLAYLNHIYRWWSDIFKDDKTAMRQVTRDTVKALEGMAPGACSADHKKLLEKFKSGKVFENFSIPHREELWERICSTSKKRLIPSLLTFFEDRKFLSDAAGAIRKVLDVNRKGTIAGCLEEMFSDINQEKDKCVIQVSETAFAHIAGDSHARLDLGIRQMWLAAFRNCREMPPDTQKRDLLALSRTKTDRTALYELSSLALQLGFESDKLKELSRESIDREIAENALLNARKPGIYQFPNWDRCIQHIVSIINSAAPVSIDKTADVIMETIRENDQPPNRYGRPNNTDYEIDRTRLFLPQMSDDVNVEMGQMTSTFVRWSVYCAYFGSPPLEAISIEDGTAMLGVEFSECEKSIPKGDEDSAFTTTNHELMTYGISQNLQDMELSLQQMRQNLVIGNQQLNEINQHIEAKVLKLNEQQNTLLNEETKLNEVQKTLELKQKKLTKIQKELAEQETAQQSKLRKKMLRKDAQMRKLGETLALTKGLLTTANQKPEERDANLKGAPELLAPTDVEMRFGELKHQEEQQTLEQECEVEKAKLEQEYKAKLATQIAQFQAQRETLEKQWETERKSNEAKIDSYQRADDHSEQRIKNYQQDVQDLQNRLQLTTSQLEEICEQKRQSNEELEKLQKERHTEEAILQNLQLNTQLTSQLEEICERKRQSNEELEKLQKELQAEKTILQSLRHNIQSTTSQLNEAKEEEEENRNQLKQLQGELQGKVAIVQSLRHNIQSTTSQLNEAKEEEEENRNQLKQLQKRSDSFSPQIPNAIQLQSQEMTPKSNQENREMTREELEMARKEFKSIQSALKKHKEELKEFKQKKQRAEEEMEMERIERKRPKLQDEHAASDATSHLAREFIEDIL